MSRNNQLRRATFTIPPRALDISPRTRVNKRVNGAFHTSDTPAGIAQQTLALFFEPERNVLPKQGEINVKGLAQVITFMGEAGLLKQPLPTAERFVELKYLQAAGVK